MVYPISVKPMRASAMAAVVLWTTVAVSPGQAAPVSTQSHSRGFNRDTVTYSDEATRTLVNSARVRHMVQDSLVTSYSAKVITRIEGRVGNNIFGRRLPIFAHEIASRVRWSLPNNLSIDVAGARIASARIPGWSDRAWAGFWTEEFAEEPWFVPRALNDSVQMIGVPNRAALHPLAVEGELHYRYAVADSISISVAGRTIKSIGVDIRPKKMGPSYVSGRIWIDAETFDVVRFSFVFVGTELFDYEPDEDEEIAAVHIEADLEYSLHEGEVWMPHRQLLIVRFDISLFGSASLMAMMTSEFSEYDINDLEPRHVASAAPEDSAPTFNHWGCEDVMMFGNAERIAACGDHPFENTGLVNGINYRVTVPALDSLLEYRFENTLSLYSSADERERTDDIIAELARVTSALPGSMAPRVPRHTIGSSIIQLAQLPRFNRVQGLSVGAWGEWPLPFAFTTIAVRGRVGLADERPVGSLSWLRNAPESQFQLIAFRDIRVVEPWTKSGSLGTSIKSAILGWDDADYYLALGGGLRFEGRMGALRNTVVELDFERQRSAVTTAGSGVNDFFFGDGVFPANPAVAEGDFGRMLLRHDYRWSRVEVKIGADGLRSSSLQGGRVWTTASIPFSVGAVGVKVDARAGSVFGDSLPQLEFRAGGPATVPGYEYGVLRARSLWSLQLEVELFQTDKVAPVVFGGVGGPFDSSDPLVGVGVGASFLQNWFRIDFSKGVNPASSVRLDIYFQFPG